MTDDKRSSRRDDSFNGTRKLIRPRLPLGGRRHDPSQGEDPLTHANAQESSSALESSHAEAFYFQKQVQQQTEMTVVLDDGEEIHGVIEWFDHFVLKLRTSKTRVLVYKSSIKYLYKASEAQPRISVMK
ncbi:RNA chaperone Hfq [Bryocella elongata]|uniref:RNA chaperone Hfq n=1 Tax=Bryocella elongata TaxID=863522 RepID=A0A1H5TTY1_9BACT|nr:RNA chaperone Hfq [Bryocella elongata]SEF66230.1 RNA chaperone Hfq [Bryocella elongata]